METDNIVAEEATENTNDIVENADENIQEIQIEIDDNCEDIDLADTPIEVEEQKKTLKEILRENPEYQGEFDEIFKKRFGREKQKIESNYNPLINTLKAGGYETDNPVEIANKIRESYEEQGISIPKYETALTEREQKALAKADAEEVIELGDEVMRDRFSELYSKQDRSKREEEEMYLIGKESSTRIAKRDLLELGADPEKVLNDKKFTNFASKMAQNVPVKEIYKLYKKLNSEHTQQVPSAGSIKDSNNNGEKFTQSKIDSMSAQELIKFWNDPEFRKIAGL